jgi:hypothetical protein
MVSARSSASSRVARDVADVAAAIAREVRALRRADRIMPHPVPWHWAASRVLPLLAGTGIDPPGEALVRAVAEPGCAVEFGLWVGSALPLVDATVAERWECSPEQIRETAFANLRRRAAELGPVAVSTATFNGRLFRVSAARPWISSLVLVPEELMRLFGDQDQVIAAPGRSLLVSCGTQTPADVIADVIVGLEMGQAHPLALDPFVVSGRRLYWESPEEDTGPG